MKYLAWKKENCPQSISVCERNVGSYHVNNVNPYANNNGEVTQSYSYLHLWINAYSILVTYKYAEATCATHCTHTVGTRAQT